jgi:hypothetical protein
MPRLYWTCAFLLAAAWLLPMHVLPWMSWHSETLAFVAVLAGCAWALLRRPGPASQALAMPRIAALPLLVALVALAQFAFGRIAYLGSVATVAAYALLCAAAAVAGHASARESADAPLPALRILSLGLVAAALAQLLVVFGQTFAPWDGAEWLATTVYTKRGGGNVAQPNQAAHLFVMAMAAVLYLRERKVLAEISSVLLLLAMCAGVAVAQSRSGLLAVTVLMAWALARARPAGLRGSVAPVAVVAVAVAMFAAWPALMNVYWGGSAEEVNLTSSGRSAMWSQFLSAVWLRPWTGWGVMQVAQAQNAIAHDQASVMAATFAHNIVLDFALWLGVPGMLLALGGLCAWFWPRIRLARNGDPWFCVALAVPLAVQSLTEFPYAYAYILAPVLFALGVLDAKVRPASAWRLPRPMLASVLALWVAATAWSILEYVRIEEDFRIARFEALSVGQTPGGYEAPRTYLLTQLDALLQATRMKPTPGMPAQDLALLRDVAMLYPWGATNFRYATALALNGQMDEAARQLQVLRALQGQKSFDRLMQVLDEMAIEQPVLKQLRQP